MSTKNTDKPYIIIPNAIVRNNSIPNISKMIYTSLTMSLNINQTRLFQQTSINGLLGVVGYNQRSENQTLVRKGLVELEKLSIINIYSDFSLTKQIKPVVLKGNTMFFVQFNRDYVMSKEFTDNFSHEEVDKELINNYGLTYTTVYMDDAVKLFAFQSKHNKANLLSCYLMAISRALIGNVGDFYSTETIESISKYANVHEKTAFTYIRALFEAELLFKLTLRETVRKTGEIRDHNVYSRWCDNKAIIAAIEGNDWFLDKTLLKVGNKILSEEQRNLLKNQSRKILGL
ncbi:hypothetical protein CEQ83_14310 [Priestia megaterium]|uniref:hypothetical protein n=1 Tax=Priestia megaterium TaxID=1404 RepID=UPI0012A8A1D8|nr:hypothetical protein [Priestia megaterium]QFY73645.1 hypothetical protein CEQ83_14310 [Priestia megaterium]